MANNPVTDVHTGIPRRGYDHDGYAEIRQRANLNEDVAPRHRSKKQKQIPPSYADYPVGSRLVCAVTDGRTGYRAYLLCRVIDAYRDDNQWGEDGRVYVAVEATNSQKYEATVGHLKRAYFSKHYRWRESTLITAMTPAEFSEMPYELVKKPA